jgi:hypothetical protein
MVGNKKTLPISQQGFLIFISQEATIRGGFRVRSTRDQAEKQPEWKDAHRKPPRVLGAALDD